MMSFLGIHCNAQVRIMGQADKDTIVAGEEFDYELTLSIPKGYDVDWKQFDDTLGKQINVKNQGTINTTAINGDRLVMKQHITMTAFDSGYVNIPRIPIGYSKNANDTTREYIYSDEYPIYVQTIDVDTTEMIKPIVAPISQSITAKEIIPWAVLAIIAGGIGFLIFVIIRNSKRKPKDVVVEKKVKKIPAIVTARAKLSEMQTNESWNTRHIKDYYTDLTDIAREYLEGQFAIEAVEMTTDEIMEAVNALSLSNSTKSKLHDTLTTADFVKFAKASPSADQNKQSFNDINSFVEDSYIYFQEEEKKKEEEKK